MVPRQPFAPTNFYSMPAEAGQTLERRPNYRIHACGQVRIEGKVGMRKNKFQPKVMRISILRRQLLWYDEDVRKQQDRITTLLSSSMAEHPAVNRRVVGSSPT